MKKLIIVGLISCSIFSHNSYASTSNQTGEWLMNTCSAGDFRKAATCKGYIVSVLDGILYRRNISMCIPTNMTFIQLRDVVIKEIPDYVLYKEQDAYGLVKASLIDKLKCKNKK